VAVYTTPVLLVAVTTWLTTGVTVPVAAFPSPSLSTHNRLPSNTGV